jgi:hypothetical protein
MQPFPPNKEYLRKNYSVKERERERELDSFGDAVNLQICMASLVGE